jgi:hypothetical protein
MAKCGVCNATGSYATPLPLVAPAECQVYHRMDLPGVGEVGGQWDLRECIGDYLKSGPFVLKF